MVLGVFMTKTSINGLLGRGSMFVLSHQQFEKLLGVSPVRKAENLIDLGAGDGEVTKVMAPYFSNVYATEMSPTMQRLLSYKGYQVLDVDSWDNGSMTYDVISCLNLLDRCDRPVTLLHAMRRVLRPDTGRVLVALVIPFKPYVEFDSSDHIPTEKLLITGATFEEQVTQLTTAVFRPAGFDVEAFSRVPYLCEGDLRHSFYVLNDALFVLKAVNS
ncbi:protein-L-histidine N-pros-methyltransferase-like isoform X3 [Babylonia areolata]